MRLSHTLVSLLASQPALAFFPTQWKEVVFGFGGTSHVAMTDEIFEDRAKAYFPTIEKLTKKMKQARDEIGEANADVDDNQINAHWHCDGETFEAAKERITQLKKDAIAALKADDATGGRKAVGGALHTIQDFYSHSNWAELGNSGANLDLQRDGNIGAYTATFEETTCDSCRFTLLDPFCSLFNCDSNTNGFTKLTSGYYHGEDTPASGKIPGHKCNHGGYTDTPLGATIGFIAGPPNPGINKDSLNCGWSPHWKLHNRAVAGAKDATKIFFDDIKAELDDERALRLLFGVGPTLAFAIDTTGSMSSVISATRSIAISIAESRIGTAEEPGLYIVSPFNDPSVGPLTVTSSLDQFKSAINSLYAYGGGDCPELIMGGMIAAVSRMEKGSTLIAFTDAAPLDASRQGELLTAANEKNIAIWIFKYDSNCDDGGRSAGKLKVRADSLSDKVYAEVAAATGGQYLSGPVSEVRRINDVLDSLITGDASPIIKVHEGIIAGAGETITYSVPADSYMTKLTCSFSDLSGSGSTSTLKISYTTPSGSPLDTSAEGVTLTSLSSSQFVSIRNPAHGEYKATISSSGSNPGRFSLICSGTSDIDLTYFNFAKVSGRVGHTGWYPLKTPPPFNQKIGALAEITGPFATATFTFRRPGDESLIQQAEMTAGSGEEGFPRTNSFFNVLQLPEESFYVYVEGKDDKGVPYKRAVDSITVPIFSDVKIPLEGNQTVVDYPNPSSSSSVPAPSSGTSTISASTTGKFHNTTTTTTASSTDLTGQLTTETISIGTTICPVTSATSPDSVIVVLPTTKTRSEKPRPSLITSSETEVFTVTACPNASAGETRCDEFGQVSTRTKEVVGIVTAVPVEDGGEETSAAPEPEPTESVVTPAPVVVGAAGGVEMGIMSTIAGVLVALGLMML
ncbi:hypothetical protein QBC44DRAFT_341414 [Cladorrhinum sp. PSN332]|nr:hypothetical protein QBC44DRAFT_341414 [Cladorrhinum sp. PSN332]